MILKLDVKCRDIILFLDDSQQASIDVSDIDNMSTDNCKIKTMSVFPNTFSFDDLGENEVVLTVTDYANNSSTCIAIVDVKINLHGENFVCYPNPTKDLISIESLNSISKIQVFSNLGTLLFEVKDDEKVDISHLSNGVYFLHIVDENGTTETKKVLKN